MRWSVMCVAGFALLGCDEIASPDRSPPLVADPPANVEPVLPVDDPVVPPADGTVSIGTLGRTVASLGNAAEPGLWLKTPLVSSAQPGRVYYPETNTTVDVTLLPIDGPPTAGSRLSLAAMQALGAPLTGLPEVDVLAG